MKRSTFVIFGIAAILFAILIPAWAISREGGEEASPQDVPADLQEGKDLFVTNCGSCHTLYKAGTDGVVGPDLDELLAPPGPTPPDPSTIEPRVLSAVSRTASAARCRRASSPARRRRRSRSSWPRSPGTGRPVEPPAGPAPCRRRAVIPAQPCYARTQISVTHKLWRKRTWLRQ